MSPSITSEETVLSKLEILDEQMYSSSSEEPSDKSTETNSSKSVSFSGVQIREYSRIIGDHPSCQSGIPVTLGWDFVEAEVEDLDKYETRRLRRRKTKHLFLSSITRFNILAYHFGYQVDDLKKAERDANMRRRKRQRYQNSPYPIKLGHDLTYSARRNFKRAFKWNAMRNSRTAAVA